MKSIAAMKATISPPDNLDHLVSRAISLAGLTLGELAQQIGVRVPVNFQKDKGWTGQLIELILGANGGSRAEQDFPDIGVELKTIPIDRHGRPLETTYVCYAHLTQIAGIEWQQSSVRNKLNCVLWVPVEGEREISPADRRVGTAILWQPTESQSQQLQQDWEELMDMIALGEVEKITAKHGQALQLRPKAADGKALTDAIGAKGTLIQTRPRGFYLRKSFTQQILAEAFCD